ncbi:hypothetical protein CW751_15215, partial [Brumimicrobium salinarum]
DAGFGFDAGAISSTNGKRFNNTDYEGEGFNASAQLSFLEYERGGNARNNQANLFQWDGASYTTNGGMLNPWSSPNPALKLLDAVEIDAAVSYQWTKTWVFGE